MKEGEESDLFGGMIQMQKELTLQINSSNQIF